MPYWFSQWYQNTLPRVHRHLGDPDQAFEALMDAMKEAGFPAGPSEEWTARVENMVMARLGQEPPHPPARLALLSNHEDLGPFRSGSHDFGKKKAAELEALLLPWQLPPLEPTWSAAVWAYFAGQYAPGEDYEVRHWVDQSPANEEAFEARYAAWEDLGWLPGALLVNAPLAWEELSDLKPATRPLKNNGLAAGLRLLSQARLGRQESTAWEVEPDLKVEWKNRKMAFRGSGGFVVKKAFTGKLDKDRLEWQPGTYGITAEDNGDFGIQVKQGEVLLICQWERFQAITGESLKRKGKRWFKEG